MDNPKIAKLTYLIDGLVVFRKLKDDAVLTSLKNLISAIRCDDFKIAEVFDLYHQFCSLALQKQWPHCLWQSLLHSENELTRQMFSGNRGSIDSSLQELAERDLAICYELAQMSLEKIKSAIIEQWDTKQIDTSTLWRDPILAPDNWPVWQLDSAELLSLESPSPANSAENYRNEINLGVMKAFETGNKQQMLKELLAYYRSMGTGIFSTAMAFKWLEREGALWGVKADPIRKEHLIGQEREQKIIIENTEFFLSGFAANNVILYGDRGTGKSSLIKALLQAYCTQGLRLIELSKNEIKDFPKVMRLLGDQPNKFIVFIDDLSFEETETEYKTLKTLLEGGLVGKPRNVLIYATSNRRHLIKETFSERQVDEVNRRDMMQEKLSLADRFGITVTFATPDQEGFLRIVEELAVMEGVSLERDLLRQQALQWVMRHNARSGRTARQFIDYLIASQTYYEK